MLPAISALRGDFTAGKSGSANGLLHRTAHPVHPQRLQHVKPESSFKGILYPARLPSFHRLPAPESVADLVQWFWIPEWDIGPGRTSRQHLIAYPGSNLVVQPDGVAFSGPTTRAAHRDLAGRGWAVGALLRPAAVPLFTAEPSSLRDREIAVSADGLHRAVSEAMNAYDGDTRRARAVDAFAGWLASRAGRRYPTKSCWRLQNAAEPLNHIGVGRTFWL